MSPNTDRAANLRLSWPALLLVGILVNSSLAAETPKPGDTPTGGGMGGTGNTPEPTHPKQIIPLNDQKTLKCSREDAVGEYLLESPGAIAQGGLTSTQPLCVEAHFYLRAKDRLRLRLKTGQELDLESKGEASIYLKRSTGRLGAQLEISIHATKEGVNVRLNKDLLVVQEGYVGQIWIDGAQVFWGLRRTGN